MHQMLQCLEDTNMNWTNFIIKTQGLDQTVAQSAAETIMMKLPAWSSYFAK